MVAPPAAYSTLLGWKGSESYADATRAATPSP